MKEHLLSWVDSFSSTPFQFSAPQYLWWLAILIPLVWCLRLGWTFASARMRLFGRAGSYPRAVVRQRERRQRLVLLTVIAGMLVSLAGPRFGFEEVEVQSQGADIFVVLDLSNSMMATDIRPSRFDRARREIFDLLDHIDSSGRVDRVGIVGFAGISFVQCPLTSDTNALREYARLMSPVDMPVQGTDVGGAIQTAIKAMEAGGLGPEGANSRAILLISDGEDFEGGVTAAVDDAVARGVRIYTVGVGTAEGAPVPDVRGGLKKDRAGNIVISRFSGQGLRAIADKTGGQYRDLANGVQIEALDFARVLDQTTRETGTVRYWFEKFQWPLGIATFLMVGLTALPLFSGGVHAPFVALMILASCMALVIPGGTANADGTADILSERERKQAYNEGVDAFERGDFATARARFEAAAKGDSNGNFPADALFNKGNSAAATGDLKSAEQAYQDALRINPGDRETEENLAWVREQLKQQKNSSEQQQDQNQDQNQEQRQNRDQQRSDSDNDQSDEKNGDKNDGQPNDGASSKEDSQKKDEVNQAEKENSSTDSKQTEKASKQETNTERLSEEQARQVLNSVDDLKSKYLYFVLPKDQQEKAKQPAAKDW